jgi:hypothetical protein
MKCFKMGYGGKNWIHLAQDMRQGRAAMTTGDFLNRREFLHQMDGSWQLLCVCVCSELSLIKRNFNYEVHVWCWLIKLSASRPRGDEKYASAKGVRQLRTELSGLVLLVFLASSPSLCTYVTRQFAQTVSTDIYCVLSRHYGYMFRHLRGHLQAIKIHEIKIRISI